MNQATGSDVVEGRHGNNRWEGLGWSREREEGGEEEEEGRRRREGGNTLRLVSCLDMSRQRH